MEPLDDLVGGEADTYPRRNNIIKPETFPTVGGPGKQREDFRRKTHNGGKRAESQAE